MNNDVHTLLGRAADDAGEPVTSARAVYAGAARVRLRRRVGVSAAAVAAVAAGAVVVPGLAPAGDRGGRAGAPEATVAAPVELAGNGGRAKELAKVLPGGVGTVDQVSLSVILKGDTSQQEMEHLQGPLDGHFSVRRDGGVGYLVIGYMDTGSPVAGSDPCEPAQGVPGMPDCVNEKRPDGSVLTVWSDPMTRTGAPRWGRELTGRLVTKDGAVLAVRDSTGFRGERAQGPLLKNPPLTRDQLRSLLLNPALLPRK
ncbi:hypothetical protein ACFVWY_32210 [Streptomyces sp. NPDC058195]|uniref:hypothetical protein n=1 Tax=Streptomyces sp. NPDC058195 TaxID=3346375 RepID=UPI0036E60DA9